MGIYFEKEKLKEKLDMHMGINGNNSTINLLNRGLRANTYVYRIVDKEFLIKKNSTFQNSIQYEYMVMKQLQSEYFMPKIYGIMGKTILIEEFIYSSPFSLSRDYGELANTLSDLHTINRGKEGFKVYKNCVVELCKQIKELFGVLRRMSNYDEKLIRCINEKMNKLIEYNKTISFKDYSVIHNDLHSANILKCKDGCRLIDWEKSKLSNYEWDLAHTISCTTAMWTNERAISNSEKRNFIRKYCENRNIHDVEECIDRVFFIEKYVELRCILWVLVNHRIIKDKLKIKLYERRAWELKV